MIEQDPVQQLDLLLNILAPILIVVLFWQRK